MEYFDYESAAREAGISADLLTRVVAAMRIEFPHDLMMLELHVLRACMAVRDGQATVDQILETSIAIES
ncbi:MAG: hypothetical protein KA354_19345 [Phycisphaerae bacterium]|nr:hypothetical protein [Phycisphaerae bacterium]